MPRVRVLALALSYPSPPIPLLGYAFLLGRPLEAVALAS